jgi:hypothetical protein
MNAMLLWSREHSLERLIERVALARILKHTRGELASAKVEIDRLNTQLRQWSKCNVALIAKLSAVERENRELKAKRQ